MYSLPRREAVLAALAAALTGLIGLHMLPLLPDLWPLTTAVLSAWMLWRIGCLGTTWRQQVRWRHAPTWQVPSAEVPLTETLLILPTPVRRWLLHRGWLADPGLLLGRAFRWTAHHTQALELALARDGALPVAEDARGGHPALHAVGVRHEHPLVLPWSELRGHVLVAGTTGSGKTRCLELLAAEAIRAPGAVVILDPKGDSDLLARCAWEAERQGRPFALFSPAFPAVSATFNPLETAATASEVATRIQALMPGGGEKRGDPFLRNTRWR